MKPSDRVSWFVEMQGVTLCSRDERVRLSIPYPHAGLWALIANRNYSKNSAVKLMSVLMSADTNDTEREVEETLVAWMQAGLLSEE